MANSVHVVVEWPQMGNSHMDFVCEFTLMCDGNDETLHAAYPLFWRVQIAKLKKRTKKNRSLASQLTLI